MIITVIAVDDYASAQQQLQLAQESAATGIELRLDYLANLKIAEVAKLRAACRLPVIFTLRKKSQGGFYSGDEAQRLATLLALCALLPDYVDIEYDTDSGFLQTLSQRYPAIQFICSYHNFAQTPENLSAIFNAMQAPYFSAYKMATQATNSLDALRMLVFSQSINQHRRFTGICMGEDGQCTRILSPVINNCFHYVILKSQQATAVGQLSLDELIEIYHFDQLNTATKIYAVLGDPVQASVGYILHNRAIRIIGNNAVYIRLRLTADELAVGLRLCRSLPFAGFSVTMPLKEVILPLLDCIEPNAEAIGAVNTVVVQNEKYNGFNTDGIGAITALSEVTPLHNQTLVIIGAGGAARAIAYTAKQQGAKLIIFNRSLAKAQKLAAELGCEARQLTLDVDFSKLHYSGLINTLPAQVYSETGMQHLLDSQRLLANKLAMDIVSRPVMTPFLQRVSQANYLCIPGYKMYIYQALGQIEHWFKADEVSLEKIQKMMGEWFADLP